MTAIVPDCVKTFASTLLLFDEFKSAGERFIQGEHRSQSALLPESLDDYVADTNPVRVLDVFVDELDLGALGFEGVVPAETCRPAYH